jgi:hypothetical protein
MKKRRIAICKLTGQRSKNYKKEWAVLKYVLKYFLNLFIFQTLSAPSKQGLIFLSPPNLH